MARNKNRTRTRRRIRRRTRTRIRRNKNTYKKIYRKIRSTRHIRGGDGNGTIAALGNNLQAGVNGAQEQVASAVTDLQARATQLQEQAKGNLNKVSEAATCMKTCTNTCVKPQ